MSLSLHSLLPPALLENPVQAAGRIPRVLMTRSNFIPGVRHRLGWRGVRDCTRGPDGLTVRVTGMSGVYGMNLLNASGDDKTGMATFGIMYFPAPDEELIESFSIQAGIAAQAEDYLDRVREFTLHDDLRALFGIAVLEACFAKGNNGVSLALTAPEHDRVIALDGVVVQTPNGPIQAVAPGGEEQDFPAQAVAMPLFNALTASASYCLGTPPQSLRRDTRQGMQRIYDNEAGVRSEPAPAIRDIRFGLGWGIPVSENAALNTPDLTWSAPDDIPEEFRDAPWLCADIPGAANSLDKRTMGITERPRLIVLTGFLGSGKTTFLANFIEEQAARNGFVAVIQNEIGKRGLDGKLLGQNYAVTEVDEGCVCCTLAGSLRSALSGILSEFQPDFVVLETTGLANPANLLSEIADLDDMLEFASVTTVLDAHGASRALRKHEVARGQVRLADVLLLNKTDLVAETELDLLEARIRELNTTGTIHRVSHGDIPATTLYGVNFRNTPKRPAPSLPFMGEHATHMDDDIQSSFILLDAPVDRTIFKQGVAGLPDTILRAKGIIQFQDSESPEIFQHVPGYTTLTPADENTENEEAFLVMIGQDSPRVTEEFRVLIGA